MDAPKQEPEQLDITIGDVRLVINGRTGLIGLHRADEHLTLVPSEAITIARVLLERLAPGRVVVQGPAGSAHGEPDWRES